jgi:hypothetical protein
MYSLKNKILMTVRRTLTTGIIMVCGAGIVGNVFSGWKRIGFAGLDIPAITTGIGLLMHDQPIVLVATKDSGVYSISGPQDSIKRFPIYSLNASDKPAGAVRTLYVDKDGLSVFAGTDSGLYGESLNSSSVPAWKKINGIHGMPVVAITKKDSIYCVATIKELFTAKSPFAAWQPCSVSKYLPSPTNAPQFSSLAWWGYGGFAAGSRLITGSNAFGGVIKGGNDGRAWENITCMYGQCVNNDVYALTGGNTSGYEGKLFAGTSRGIFWAQEFDTGQWYEMSPQLKTWPARHLYITFDSMNYKRDIFASTDSGVYVLSPKFNPGQWTLSLNVKAFGVTSLPTTSQDVWFAATSDGVWKYEPTTMIRNRNENGVSSSRHASIAAYSIDGRRIASSTQLKRVTGVYITLQQTGKYKKLLLFPAGKTKSLF